MRDCEIKIFPEYTARASIVNPNPLLEVSINYIVSTFELKTSLLKIADYGCGKLRHLYIFLNYFGFVYLVDTQFQLSRYIKLFGKITSVRQYVSSLRMPEKVEVLSGCDFEKSNLRLDLIFSIAVFDVILPEQRVNMIKTAYENLKENGLFVLIIPRNDSSILKRCTINNKYEDGYIFKHHGVVTFFRNFKHTENLIKRIEDNGFLLIKDLSKYRTVCLIFKKTIEE